VRGGDRGLDCCLSLNRALVELVCDEITSAYRASLLQWCTLVGSVARDERVARSFDTVTQHGVKQAMASARSADRPCVVLCYYIDRGKQTMSANTWENRRRFATLFNEMEILREMGKDGWQLCAM
jgi:hypothetical protein